MKCLKSNGNKKKPSGVQVYLIQHLTQLREHMENYNFKCIEQEQEKFKITS